MLRKKWTYIAVRILSLVLLCSGMNLLYKHVFFEKDLQLYSSIINLIRDVPPDVDIIYLGESSNNTVHEDDQDKRKISDFIADYYPGLTLYDMHPSLTDIKPQKVCRRLKIYSCNINLS